MYSPILQTRIIGDINIARYISRFLLPDLYEENSAEVVASIDQWMDASKQVSIPLFWHFVCIFLQLVVSSFIVSANFTSAWLSANYFYVALSWYNELNYVNLLVVIRPGIKSKNFERSASSF